MPDLAGEEIREVTRLWWLLLLAGAVSVVVGILLLVWPNRTLEVIAILAGIELLLVGIIQIVVAVRASPGARGGPLLRGALAGIAGLIVIRHPGQSLLVIALAIGIYLVVSGVMQLLLAFEARTGRGWLLLGALVDIAIGVILVAWPSFGVTSLAVVLGIALIVRGLLEALASFALRSAKSALPTG
jgi:uncharacterized membrane protein HdeD (DUF308 family)